MDGKEIVMAKIPMKVWIKYSLGLKTELTEDEKKEVQVCEFAMHLLVPTESINRYINLMGGIDNVKNDIFKIEYLADLYKVPTIIIKLKLDYLSNKNIEENSKTKEFKLNT